MDQSKLKHFEKLTPAKNIEKMTTYEEALNFSFNEPDLLNIAVTGPYSAGKSSVINNYEEKKSKKFMHVSLAHFEDPDNNTDKSIDKIQLEGKILNQIIHQINPKNIPQTNFKIKSDIPLKKLFINTFFITSMLFMTLFLLFFPEWSAHINGLTTGKFKKLLLESTSNEFYVFILAIYIILTGIFLFFIVKMQLERPFLKKIKVEKYEIEVFEDKEDSSYFDKHLDDILYLFRNSNMDAFIFEDIDRYNMNIIFSKLREINLLINKNSKKEIRFIYLLRDDIFTSKDRTKFFDFIIPIVPVIDSSNSYDKIIEIFREGGIFDHFNPIFLERLSLYIDDMRILKNIYNEYVIYHDSIQGTELKPEKLLAIITYKNLFPKDFSNLQYNKGHVFNVFANKEFYKEKISQDIIGKLEVNKSLIQKVENENLNSVDELDALFLDLSNFRVNSNGVEFVREAKISENVINQHGYRIDFKEHLANLNNNKEYIKRKEILEKKSSDRIALLNVDNEKLNKQLKNINALKLKELITKDNMNDIFNEKEHTEIRESQYYDLIKYLIRNGYIDETYADYLTYFWGQDLTRSDKIFVRSITDEKAKEFDYKLEKTKSVVKRLTESDFEKEEVLNFYLLDHLLINNHKYLPLLLKQIKEQKHFTFAFDYIEWSENSVQFIRVLNKSWKNIWIDLKKEATVSEFLKKTYLVKSIYYSDLEDIISMNENNCLTNYISESDDFIEIDMPIVDSIVQALKSINVKLQSINYDKVNKGLFMEVYRNNLYALNYSNIELILKVVFNEKDPFAIKQKNYTIISSNMEEPLKEYIDQNINDYMITMIANAEDEINDSEEAAISILNNKDITNEIKQSYLQKLTTELTNITDIKDTLWEDVIHSDNLIHSVTNILNYFNEYAGMIDSTLLTFLNSSINLKFNFNKLKIDYKEDDLIEFFEKVIETNKIENEVYEMVLGESNMTVESFDLKDIENEKLTLLIRMRIIEMNLYNLKFIRENFPYQMIAFACQNINEYMELLDTNNNEVIEEELLLLLDEATISIEIKLELLKYFSTPISLKFKTYPEEILELIISKYFYEEDLEYLISNYSSFSQTIKNAIEEAIIIHIDKVLDEIIIDEKDLLIEILKREEIDLEKKMRLLYSSLENLSEYKIQEYLTIMKNEEFLSLFNGKRPKIEKNDINLSYLKYFEKKGWISSFSEDPNDNNFCRAIGRSITRA